jgi:hypothetical protein
MKKSKNNEGKQQTTCQHGTVLSSGHVEIDPAHNIV